MKKRILSVCCVLIFMLVLILILNRQKTFKNFSTQSTGDFISKTAFKLNTVVTIKLYDSEDESILDEALALCDYYENIFSRTKESGELYQLNHGTLPQENGAYVLSSDLAELIEKGLYYSELSDGGFDITIGPVSSLWDFTSEEKTVPSQEEIENALPLVNYKNVILEGNRLSFAQPEMELDLGAIAKGYIADKIKSFLVSEGIKSAVIDLGGNTLLIGQHPDGTPFRVGVQKPFTERGETVATLEETDKSIVSSGTYERYFEKDGTLYHHILNPKTGYPYDNTLQSVTIISDQSVDGDGLSTACFALGPEKGMELIDSLPDVEAVFITDGDVYLTEETAEKVFHKKRL